MRKFSLLTCLLLILALSGCQKKEETTVHMNPAPPTATGKPTIVVIPAPPAPASPAVRKITGADKHPENQVAIEAATNVSGKVTAGERVLLGAPVDKLPDLTPTFAEKGVTVSMDVKHSSDLHGALKITSSVPRTHVIRLYALENVNITGPLRLGYRARLMTGGMDGQAYLLLKADVGRKHPAQSVLNGFSGNSYPDFTRSETSIFLKKGEIARRVELAVVIEGAGTIWVDDVSLFSAPLPKS